MVRSRDRERGEDKHVQTRGWWGSIVRGAQGNFDILKTWVQDLAGAHNGLVDDFNELADWVEENAQVVGDHAHDGPGAGGDLAPALPALHDQSEHDAAEDADIQDIGTANSAGAGEEVAGARHVHNHPSIATGNLHPEYLTEAEADALYVELDQAEWVDLTDGGATALHSHAGGGSTVAVEEDNVEVDSAVSRLDFGHGLDVASDGADEVNIVVDEAELDADLITADDAGGYFTGTSIEDQLQELGAQSGTQGLGAFINKLITGARTFLYMEFLEAAAGSNFLTPLGAGTGASVQVPSPAGEMNHPGIINADTGTTATGRMMFRPGQGNSDALVVPGGGRIRFGCIVRLNDLSDGTNTYTFIMGFTSTPTVITVNTGAVILYSHGVNSGKWQGVTDDDNAGDQTVDLGVAVAADTWYNLEVEINAAGTQAEFFIDHVSCGTISTNVPSGAGDEMVPFLGMIKSAGLTARAYDLDFVYFLQEFSTPR